MLSIAMVFIASLVLPHPRQHLDEVLAALILWVNKLTYAVIVADFVGCT